MPANRKKKEEPEGLRKRGEDGDRKQRQTSNIDLLTQSTEEKILQNVHELYTEGPNALKKIAENIGMESSVLAPRKKITVLLTGNHSSGKSSFINWYVGEHIQRTGVAIETQGFTIVQSGKRRESIQGPACISLYPQLKEIAKEEGVLDNLSAEISISTEKKFSLVHFIDSPGLVDGNTNYPFDIEKIIKFFGQQADLIFVFFDPIGQALCKRMMNVVDVLNKAFPQKLHYFLSKADDVDSSQDLQKVLVQMTQNLSLIIRNKGFELRTIYISDSEKKGIPNAIQEVCKEIEKTINANIQRALNQLEVDSKKLDSGIESILTDNDQKRKYNAKARNRGLGFALTALFFPFLLLLSLFHQQLVGIADNHTAIAAIQVLQTVGQGVEQLLKNQTTNVVVGALGFFVFFMVLSKIAWKQKEVLSKKQINKLKEQQHYLRSHILKIKQDLYQQYFQQFVSDFD